MERLQDFEVAKPGSPISALKRSRKFKTCAVLLAGVLLVIVSYPVLLRQIGSYLIVQDALRPAAAIVVLAGQTPVRELEGARLYHAGLAPQVIIVRDRRNAESEALQQLRIKKPQSWN